ncbi:hypothetical protein ENSA7_23800 [Enhygromyxa salina]|uniref:Transposase zinc-binding domain-containing protein n=1 Tax=Enhygromyxa salina TaxID=215803 RepID=A0A2S9YS62_9BACT|nr:hypothetical protein ENSA7_23800 [Enhygromyxa salina]
MQYQIWDSDGCSPCSTTPRRDSYQRRRPDETLLYQLIEEHWPTFLEPADKSGGLPDFIVEEFEAYLRCGMLEHGLAHFACRQCGESLAVAFSCKKRGFCPSCTGRRMADVAAHLVDEVFPEVPVRQWVCSLPWRLRYAMGYDRKLCADVLDAFIVSLRRSLRRRAKAQLLRRAAADRPRAARAHRRSSLPLQLSARMEKWRACSLARSARPHRAAVCPDPATKAPHVALSRRARGSRQPERMEASLLAGVRVGRRGRPPDRPQSKRGRRSCQAPNPSALSRRRSRCHSRAIRPRSRGSPSNPLDIHGRGCSRGCSRSTS